uniref:Uncharacterized protein n=1 Tax=Anguilla anguilla TaxID=7936 RepID=A0A0E9R574_ANGAN
MSCLTPSLWLCKASSPGATVGHRGLCTQ